MPLRPSIPLPHRSGFRFWRLLVFAVSAVVLFVIVALGLTAYLGFTARAVIDTEDVSVASAERFGRFEMPPSARGLKLRARGSPLEGELFAKFTIDPDDVARFVGSTPLRTPLRADARLAARAASMTDKPWWNPPAPAWPPARATVPPARAEVPPARAKAPPARAEVPQTRTTMSPTQSARASPESVDAPPTRDTRPAPAPLAALHTERGYTLLLVLDTSDRDHVTVYLHATNR